MKKLLLLLLAFPLLGWIASADVPEREVFPRNNAIWNISKSYHPDRSYWFGLTGDTVINDTTYQKLYLLKDTSLLPEALDTLIGGIRQENQKVWYRRIPYDYFNEEVLLYDFSLNKGDTIPGTNISNDSFSPFSDFRKLVYGELAVVKDVYLDDQGRKHLLVDLPNYLTEEWIEGVGGIEGLFFQYRLTIPTKTDTWNGLLKCMKHNGEIKYRNREYQTCASCLCLDQLTVNIEEISIGLFFISSFSNGIRIVSENIASNYIFQLYDLNGVLLQTQPLIESTTTIPLDKIKKGVYLYRISDSTNNSQAGKIILQ